MKRAYLLLFAGPLLLVSCSTETMAPTPSASPDFGNVAPKPGAHFQRAAAFLDGADLVATFREVGLGEGNVTITLSAFATAEYACRNNGGEFPNDAKKQSVSGPVAETQDFPVAKNGHVEGSLSVSPPASTLFCPNGQTIELVSISYVGVLLSDITNQVSAEVPGIFSAIFFTDVP